VDGLKKSIGIGVNSFHSEVYSVLRKKCKKAIDNAARMW